MTQKIAKNNDYIHIKGAKLHNLKNIEVKIPRDKLIVITGLSGSGKSSLAFNTLYAEGQRRYVESLSSYARQFLGRINKPEVDFIKGIPPAIAIEQKVNTRNPRSTVGTSTEIYDYLKLLFARIGKTYSPISGNEVKKDSVGSITNHILSYPEGTKFMILSPISLPKGRTATQQLEILLKQGFSRIEINDKILRIENVIKEKTQLKDKPKIVIDRGSVNNQQDNKSRIADSIQTALFEGKGYCFVQFYIDNQVIIKEFSDRFELDGMEFIEPSTHLFSFNNPIGACPKCEGFGKIIDVDENLVIPNKNLSVYEDAIACWKGEKLGKWKEKFIYSANKFNFPIHKPYFQLNDKQKELLWTGNKHFHGLNDFFAMLESESYKIQNRVLLSRYRGKTTCSSCKGARLKPEALYVKVNDTTIDKLVNMSIGDLITFFDNIRLNEYEQEIAERILIEIKNRLKFLNDVGLSYLNLNRLSSSLSGGESQRINLATSLGSSLVGSLYILDEPSIGLHSRDTSLLISVLKNLQAIGNTVIVVEHDEDIINSSDYIIDIGPLAGSHGGELVFAGTHDELLKSKKGLTMEYLLGKRSIDTPKKRRKWKYSVDVIGARMNNLKGVTVKFPLQIMTVVTGVSGSGKSSLVKGVLYEALNTHLRGYGEGTIDFEGLDGDLDLVKNLEFVNQNPIGKSSRSNPVTYLKAFDEIRKLYSVQAASKINNFKPAHFSFNVEGGRCEECKGEGEILVEMQFMADVHLVCESCKGKRFKDEVLEVKYRSKNIYEVLDMTVDEAIEFFSKEKKIKSKLQPLADVGLGYVKLGQSSNTLSGGESQRVKLASFLQGDLKSENCLFIFDEPTTGLHFHDINKLLQAFNALIEKGHSVLIIEHNLEIIKSADWIIDLGPEGGKNGGKVLFEGTPEELVSCKDSYTGKFLKQSKKLSFK